MVKFDYSQRRKMILGIAIVLTVLLYVLEDFFSATRLLSKIGVLLIFYIVDHFFDARFKQRHYLFIILIGIFGFIFSPWYFKYPLYDKILHFCVPILFSSIAFHLVNKLSLKLKWKLIFTFFVIAGSISIFEISEYALDLAFDLRLQGVFFKEIIGGETKYTIISNSLDDTMVDTALGIAGSIFYMVYAFTKYRLKSNRTTRQNS